MKTYISAAMSLIVYGGAVTTGSEVRHFYKLHRLEAWVKKRQRTHRLNSKNADFENLTFTHRIVYPKAT